MNLVHVVPHISEEASGPSYSVPRLCQALSVRGHDVELSCLAARGAIPGVRVDVHPQWPIFGRFAISPSHALALRDKARCADIVHNHSLWSMSNVAAGWIVPGGRAKLVTSPRGTLSEWALERRRGVKRVLWPAQRRVLDRASLLHATSEVEYEEIRARGITVPVATIPNGIDLPLLAAGKLVLPERTLLFLSRIHPVKGIDRLLHAWQRLQHRHPGWRLLVAGGGEPAHVRESTQLAERLALQRVGFPGPLYGADKSKAYFEAELFVLPSHSENFGMVVAEALAHRCPTVVSRGAPWRALATEGCGWWVAHDVETLTETLDTAMRLSPERLAEMGARGREYMEREFSWDSVAQRMEAVYRWLVECGDCPDSVRKF